MVKYTQERLLSEEQIQSRMKAGKSIRVCLMQEPERLELLRANQAKAIANNESGYVNRNL